MLLPHRNASTIRCPSEEEPTTRQVATSDPDAPLDRHNTLPTLLLPDLPTSYLTRTGTSPAYDCLFFSNSCSCVTILTTFTCLPISCTIQTKPKKRKNYGRPDVDLARNNMWASIRRTKTKYQRKDASFKTLELRRNKMELTGEGGKEIRIEN